MRERRVAPVLRQSSPIQDRDSGHQRAGPTPFSRPLRIPMSVSEGMKRRSRLQSASTCLLDTPRAARDSSFPKSNGDATMSDPPKTTESNVTTQLANHLWPIRVQPYLLRGVPRIRRTFTFGAIFSLFCPLRRMARYSYRGRNRRTKRKLAPVNPTARTIFTM
jgi:hypothetical protein